MKRLMAQLPRKLIILAAAWLMSAGAYAELVGLYQGTWTMNEYPGFSLTVDMNITSLVEDAGSSRLEGFFDWSCETLIVPCSATETFAGTLVGANIELIGQEIFDDTTANSGFAVSVYTGIVSSDGLRIGGSWRGVGSDERTGDWAVVRVPEPATLGLLLAGILGMCLFRSRRAA